jgi:hypothetical protein
MVLNVINWFAVVVSVVASMVIGSIWYHPKVFFNVWWKGIGKKEGEIGQASPAIWIFVVLASFVEAVALAFMIQAMGARSVGSGALAGFMIWLGFVAPTNLVDKLFAGHGWKVWLIEVGDHLAYLLVAGIILSVWR